jgi:hypothetical protein
MEAAGSTEMVTISRGEFIIIYESNKSRENALLTMLFVVTQRSMNDTRPAGPRRGKSQDPRVRQVERQM